MIPHTWLFGTLDVLLVMVVHYVPWLSIMLMQRALSQLITYPKAGGTLLETVCTFLLSMLILVSMVDCSRRCLHRLLCITGCR